MRNHTGFGIIEVIIAMAIFTTIAVTGTVTVIGSFTTNRLGSEETEATLIAQQGIEAARSIKNQGWSTPFLATSCTSGCGISNSGGTWVWSGTNNTIGTYTRVITVSDVQRNGSGVIVSSGGTNDPNTKKITSTVSWAFSPGRNNSVDVSTYITYWENTAPTTTPTPTLTPTPTPTSCNAYVITQGYSSGTCRQNASQCTNHSEVHLSGGDVYCTGGANADTCCALPGAGGTPTPTPTPTATPIPTATSTPTPVPGTPTPTPTTAPSTCSQYCANNGYSSGTCRQNTNQCTNHGESHQAGGDAFCTGGANADTCCCLP